MKSHYIIVEETRNASAASGTRAYYGPFLTLDAAQSARAEHPQRSAMEIVALDHLTLPVDPCAMHPSASGV